MKHRIAIMLIFACFLVGVAVAQDESAAAAQVTVTDVQIDPTVFMQGDTGTITVEITNNGASSVAISRATLLDGGVALINEGSYDSVGSIGAGNKLQFTFTVRTDGPDGIYYPKFYLDFRNAGSLRYLVPVKVESTELQVSVIDRPETFSEGKKETIQLLIGNPRENGVNGVTVTPVGDEIEVTQSSYFLGNLAPDASANVSFDITPIASTNLTFHVTYRNGINTHVIDRTLPVVIGEAKKIADPVLNNIELIPESGYYRVTGDVTNAGLDTAKSVVITSGSPAEPVDPFRLYVVGSLDPDDFSSFEVTFRAESDVEEAPILIQYKDEDGNSFEQSFLVELTGETVPEDESGWSPLLIAGIIVIAIVIAGIAVYTWKRK
jgi:hypothetical protein